MSQESRGIYAERMQRGARFRHGRAGISLPQVKSEGATDKGTDTVAMQGANALKSLTGADIRQFRKDGELQFLRDQTSFIVLIPKDFDR